MILEEWVICNTLKKKHRPKSYLINSRHRRQIFVPNVINSKNHEQCFHSRTKARKITKWSGAILTCSTDVTPKKTPHLITVIITSSRFVKHSNIPPHSLPENRLVMPCLWIQCLGTEACERASYFATCLAIILSVLKDEPRWCNGH